MLSRYALNMMRGCIQYQYVVCLVRRWKDSIVKYLLSPFVAHLHLQFICVCVFSASTTEHDKLAGEMTKQINRKTTKNKKQHTQQHKKKPYTDNLYCDMHCTVVIGTKRVPLREWSCGSLFFCVSIAQQNSPRECPGCVRHYRGPRRNRTAAAAHQR